MRIGYSIYTAAVGTMSNPCNLIDIFFSISVYHGNFLSNTRGGIVGISKRLKPPILKRIVT
jgi:hypothetical protein